MATTKMTKKGSKPRNFFHLKKECELLTRVALEGRESNNYSWLINNVYSIKEALTLLQIVAKRYRKDWKWDTLKTKHYKYRIERSFRPGDWGADRFGYVKWHYPRYWADNKSMCFYQQFKDLTAKNYLVTIRVASRKLANKCMKNHRDTGALCSKRYYSLFRALEKQIHRLDTTLGKQVYYLSF